MITDIRTVMWKELREFLTFRGSVRSTIIGNLLTVVFIGVFFPLQAQEKWVTSPASLSIWFMISFILVSSAIADSFAGERERHTLPTLLASRLPETAILLGKIAAAVSYAFTAAAVTVLVSLISINIVFVQDGFLVFPPSVIALGIATGLITATTMATIGTLVSLRAKTARQAQQTLGIAAMLVFVVPIISAAIIPRTLMQRLVAFVEQGGVAVAVGTILTFAVIADIIIFLIVLKRFKRQVMLLE